MHECSPLSLHWEQDMSTHRDFNFFKTSDEGQKEGEEEKKCMRRNIQGTRTGWRKGREIIRRRPRKSRRSQKQQLDGCEPTIFKLPK